LTSTVSAWDQPAQQRRDLLEDHRRQVLAQLAGAGGHPGRGLERLGPDTSMHA
jgi:hypothetical protein